MKFKQICKTFLTMSAWGLLVIALYIGALTVLANYPEAPEGESEWGWLGEIFNLNQSSSDKLIVESAKVGIGKTDPITALDVNGVVKATSFSGNGIALTGVVTNPATSDVNLNNKKITNLAPPTMGTDAVNMDYVDNQVVAAGGGGNVIELSCAWRYDYQEGVVANGSATNWQCTPPVCPSGWTDAGVVFSEPTSVACPGYNSACSFNNGSYHPVTVGRSIRYCFR